jgi:carbonic anhydrase/acetyltransferase-like protein (isoleucine patch superfamily)
MAACQPGTRIGGSSPGAGRSVAGMIVEHAGKAPSIDPTAWVAPNAVLSGDVVVGPGCRILYGAVLTAEGAPVRLGEGCVVMEQAVLRAAGRFPLHLGDQVLVGPHAYLSGCTVGDRAFVATGTMVFNGAVLGAASTVAIGAKVHIGCELPAETRVPMGFIAVGRPAEIYAPDDARAASAEVARLDFMRYVFGVETDGRSRSEVMADALGRYTRALGAHLGDQVLASDA